MNFEHCPDVICLDPDHIMRAPCIQNYQPDQLLRERIARYFSLVIGGRRTEIAKHLPTIMPSWGKMRIRHGGDTFRTASTARRNNASTAGRNNSYIRVRNWVHFVCP
jgi:hypothetical protein